MSGERVIIVHCHIFKNGGSTFDWVLARYFGDRFLDHRDNESMRRGAAYLGPFLEAHPHLAAISSHHVQLPLPVLPGARLIPVFFLRHPVERAYSVYRFERRQPEETLGGRMAKRLSFQDYVRWRMEPDTPATLRDFQTRCCIRGPLPPQRVLGDADFETAAACLEATPAVGVVDLYEHSMVIIEAALRRDFPDLDMAYVPQNVGTYRAGEWPGGRLRRLLRLFSPARRARVALARTDVETGQRALWVLEQLGSELGEQLLDNNARDMRLYLHARSLVQRRFSEMENANRALETFRDRCNSLLN